MSKVQIKQTALSMYIDDMECYEKCGHILFRDSGLNVENYIVAKERGYPLRPRERVFHLDGDLSNLDPSNLVVFEQGVDESPQQYLSRIQEGMRLLRLKARIPDLETRPTTKGSAWPLSQQIKCLQRLIDRKLQRGFEIEAVKDIARVQIKHKFYDVKMSDLLFGDEEEESEDTL